MEQPCFINLPVTELDEDYQTNEKRPIANADETDFERKNRRVNLVCILGYRGDDPNVPTGLLGLSADSAWIPLTIEAASNVPTSTNAVLHQKNERESKQILVIGISLVLRQLTRDRCEQSAAPHSL